jgi:hypothetical protein
MGQTLLRRGGIEFAHNRFMIRNDDQTPTPVEERPVSAVPAMAVLDRWSAAAWTDGCQVDRLPDMQPLTVITRNHLYELFVICGAEGRVRVRGGNFFPDWREATLAGCSLGGSFLKLRGVYAGFCMELYVNGESIITSPVQKLTLAAIDGPRH